MQNPELKPAPGRNDNCPCGSGRKYKHCCVEKDRAISFENDQAHAHYQRAVKLERLGRTEEAIAAYKIAAASTPVSAEANSRLGHLFLSLGRAKEAADALRAAAAASPGVTERRMDLVRALTLEKKDAEAEAEVRQVLIEDPKSSDGYWLLGRILTDAGKFAEARAALERAVALNPDQGGVYYDLVRSYTLTEADRPLINRMLAAARSLSEVDQRIRLQFALGKAFDDLKDYGSAMQHFARANAIKKAMGVFDREGFARRVENLIARFTPEYLTLHRQNGGDSRLPIMVLGMPRSGTTLVEQIISSHRDIGGAGELQFWPGRGQLFERLTAGARVSDFLRRAAQDCVATLQEVSPASVRVVDKNPFNFLWIGLIQMVFPNAVVIHCRRNALDTCLSNFSTYFLPRPDFSTDADDLIFYYRQYTRLMDHWRAVLPPGRLVEVDYEELVAAPEPTARRLIAACGLPWDEACLHPERNDRVVRTASKWQVRQPINPGAVHRWRRYEAWLGSLSELRADG